jgi:hypothetical protein
LKLSDAYVLCDPTQARRLAMTIASATSGVLLPIFSLPSAHGIGDLGQAAYKFADALAEHGCTVLHRPDQYPVNAQRKLAMENDTSGA